MLMAGKVNARERGETPSTFNYTEGSPGKLADRKFGVERYAGDIFQGKGVKGEFAMAITDPKNKEASEGTEEWMNQFMSGIYSPFDMGPPAGGMA